MGESKQGLMVVEAPKGVNIMQHQNPIVQIQTKFKEIERGFNSWVSKQPLHIEATAATAGGAAQGAFLGGLMGAINRGMSSSMPMPPPSSSLNPKAMAALQSSQALSAGPLIQGRNFSVLAGVNAGLSCVLKKLRGKEDVQSSMIAAFGSGAMFTLVSGVGGPNPIPNMISSGAFFALAQGGIYKLGEMFSKQQVEDPSYMKTKRRSTLAFRDSGLLD